jgi:branched-chain amino acid transport system substrate-binding protein
LAIVACGSNQKPSSTTTNAATAPTHNGKTVEIYSSLPESGPEAARSLQIEAGIRLAWDQAHHTAGGFRLKYQALCDSKAPTRRKSHAPTSRGKVSTTTHAPSRKCTGSWTQAAAAHNAEIAASNPQTVAYIGDLNSGATAVSLPILNQAGIVQITPGSGYPGLTDAITVKKPKGIHVTQAGEPSKYYPRGLGHRTLLRMIPSDLVQASAALYVLQKAGCQKFAAWNFGSDTESGSLLAAVVATATKDRMAYVTPALPKQTKEYLTYTQTLGHQGVRCAIMIGHVTPDAVQLTNFLGNQLPDPTIVGSTGFCSPTWIGGVSKIVVPRLYCTTPALPVTEYAGSAGFIKAFRKAAKHKPTAYNLYGYAATEMLLRALADTGSEDDPRAQVLTNMVYGYAPSELAETPGQIKAFSFTPHGNLETPNDDGIDSYGVDQFKHGKPGHFETVSIDTAHLLSSGG